MEMGRNALYYEDYVLSINYFNQVISAKSYLSEPYFYRGLAKFYLEDYHGAENDCSISIEHNPFIIKTYQLRGLCRIKLERFYDAIQDYSQVVHYEDNNQIAWYNRVLCRLRLKDYQRADAELDTMIQKWPSYNKIYGLKAQIALEKKDSVLALKYLNQSIALNTMDADIYAAKALILLQQGHYADADTAYTQAIKYDQKDVGLYINRALSRYHQKNLRGAMDDYDRAYGLKSVRLRYFNVAGADIDTNIGEWHEPETHLIPNILKSTFGSGKIFEMYGNDYETKDGTCVRDYIDIGDLVDAHILALKYLNNGGDTNYFNLGTNSGSTVKDVFSACEDVTEKDIPVKVMPRRAGDPATLVADNKKAKQILGWTPEKSLTQSIQTAYRWELKCHNSL